MLTSQTAQLQVLHCSKYFEGKKHPAPNTAFDVIFVTSFANDQNDVIARAIIYPGSSVSETDANSSPCFEVLESSISKTNFQHALINLWDKLQVSTQENELLKCTDINALDGQF